MIGFLVSGGAIEFDELTILLRSVCFELGWLDFCRFFYSGNVKVRGCVERRFIWVWVLFGPKMRRSGSCSWIVSLKLEMGWILFGWVETRQIWCGRV